MEDEGFRVVVAEDGMTALKLVREEQPDLILSNVMLPGMDGIELAKRVGADPDLKGTPVVLMSAGRRPDGDAEGLCRAFIPKPFDIDRVVKVVEDNLSA